MRLASSLAFALILASVLTTPAVFQTLPSEIRTVTFYSPLKHELGRASPSGRPRPDLTRAYFDFIRGEFRAVGRWDLSFGLISNGYDDWFLVRVGDDERSAIKDLGQLGWNENFKLPIIPPLAALKPGEHRTVNMNSSSENTSSAERSRGLPSEIRGAPSARDQDIGLPSRDTNAGPEIPTPLRVVTQPGSKRSKSDPVLAKVISNHMYLVRVVDAQSDFYVLVRVDGLVPGDNCTISWKRLSASESPSPPKMSASAKVASTNAGPSAREGSFKGTTWTLPGDDSVSKSGNPVLAQTETHEKTSSQVPIEKPPALIADRPDSVVGPRAPQKPELKAFGSSLDTLKWDPDKQAAVEIKEANDNREGVNSEDVVRVETRLVVSDVLVLDAKGRAVEGLTQNDFVVTEDGVPQQISHFSLGDDTTVARSIVLILDYSSSLAPYIEMSVAAAKKLVNQLSPKDSMAIVTDDVELLTDFTSDKTRLSRALDSLETKGSSFQFGKSAQFSALLATLRELFSVEDIRPIIVFQTDGDQIGFMQPADAHFAQNPGVRQKIVQFSLNDVNAAVEKSRRITIYSVLPGFRLIGLPPSEQARRADIIVQNDVLTAYRRRLKNNPNLPPPPPLSLRPQDSANNAAIRLGMQQAAAGVAEISGGKTFFLEQPEQAGDIYAQILSDVNRRYVIGYYPSNKSSDGKRRKVAVEVRNHPEYTVEGRKTYIASGSR